jgi:nucleoid-associated protein YgaU
MSRILTLIALVGVLMATGVAGAAPDQRVRLPVSPPPAGEAAVGPDTVVVAPGDHLWKISERRLGPASPDEVIAPYWLEVIQANTPRLRSGDPDLIYPGEVVELPAIPEQR